MLEVVEKKPWRQKGTGRARAGTTRSPLWRGGGVTFGPLSTQNPSKAINKKMKQAALRMVLTDKLDSDEIILVDSLTLPEIKTKQVCSALSKLPIKGHKILFVIDNDSKNLVRSSRNVVGVKTLGADSLNLVELMKASSVIIPIGVISIIESLYAPKGKKKSVKKVAKKAKT